MKQIEELVDLDIPVNKIIEMFRKGLFFIVVFCTVNFNGIYGQTVALSQTEKASLLRQEYLYAFTEATKQFLFGNYIQAVSLYKECLKIDPNSGAVNFQLSRIYMNAGNTALAKFHGVRAVKSGSDNIWYLQNLASIYQAEEKYDSTLLIYQQLNKIEPENVNIMYAISGLCETLGKNHEAITWLDKIDERIGHSREVSLSKFRNYEKISEPEKAIESLKAGVSGAEEGDYNILGMIAEFYRNQGKLDSAAHYYRLIFPEYHADPLVTFSYAGYLMDIGNKDSARNLVIQMIKDTSYDNQVKTTFLYNILQNEKELERYHEILDTVSLIMYENKPNDLQNIAVYADVQLRLRNYDNAIHILKKLISIDKNNYTAYEQLLYVMNFQGQADSVLFYSQEALKIWDKKPFIYLFRGSAFYQKRFYNDAVDVLNSGLGITDDAGLKVEFMSLLAECYQRVEEYDKSEKVFKEALIIDRNNSGIKNNYAYYLSLREKDLKLAEKMSSETINSEPQNGTYLDTYGWILYKQGKVKKAQKYILEALKYGGSESREVLMHAAEIYWALKEYEIALKYYQAAIGKSEGEELNEVLAKIEEVKKMIKEK